MTTVTDRPAADRASPDRMAAARKAMIDSQLRTSGVSADFAIARMARVAREDFVPAAARGVAYSDRALPLGDGRWLAAPIVQGMMLQEASPDAADKALVVDGGSGYLAELLRPLVASLDTIDPSGAFEASRKKGYTLLLVDGAVEHLPEPLIKRLAEGGRIVCGLVQQGVTRLARGQRSGASAALLPVAEIGMPVLPEFARPKAWTF